MFVTPINEIDFRKVVEFCQLWPEGVRVEYKAELTNIPKVVSSLANTVGGIAIFGVDTDRKTNMPCFPISGMEIGTGFEERITQACIQGVYPPITPSVKVIPIPSNPEKVIGVVKVHESLDAPHAIENTTRVYIRVNSTTEPIQLADIDRIEYLLTRRKGTEKRRESLIGDVLEKFRIPGVKRLYIIVGPIYPHRQILTRDSLGEKIGILRGNSTFSYLVERFRRCQDGYISAKPFSLEAGLYHLAISFYGFLTYAENIDTGFYEYRDRNFPVMELVEVVLRIADVARAGAIVLEQDEAINLFIRVWLENVSGVAIHPGEQLGIITRAGWYEEHKVSDSDRLVQAETYCTLETLKEQPSSHILDLVKQLMWGFNWSDDYVSRRTGDILRANGVD